MYKYKQLLFFLSLILMEIIFKLQMLFLKKIISLISIDVFAMCVAIGCHSWSLQIMQIKVNICWSRNGGINICLLIMMLDFFLMVWKTLIINDQSWSLSSRLGKEGLWKWTGFFPPLLHKSCLGFNLSFQKVMF